MKQLKEALEALVLFTKPSKFNAVALHNAHRVLADCSRDENEQLRAQVEELKENCRHYLHEVEGLKAKLLQTKQLLNNRYSQPNIVFQALQNANSLYPCPLYAQALQAASVQTLQTGGKYFANAAELAAALDGVQCMHDLSAELIAESVFR